MNDGSGFVAGMFVTLGLFIAYDAVGLLLFGSTRDDILAKHIEQAQEVCETNEGVFKIEGETFGYHKLICVNGAVFTYTPPKTNESQ